jgi:DNA-binding NarL/FixJ family response regulator
MSERTARSHVSTILGKLNLSSRTEAALYALRTGLARLAD